MYRRNSDAADRMRERRRLEDAAPRLSSEIPALRSLRLSLSFRRGEFRLGETSYVRIIVVPTAPALFWVACADPSCREGGHQITAPMLKALKAHDPQFCGEDLCRGMVGAGAACASTLIYEAVATYD
jgi:hypothetical protein